MRALLRSASVPGPSVEPFAANAGSHEAWSMQPPWGRPPASRGTQHGSSHRSTLVSLEGSAAKRSTRRKALTSGDDAWQFRGPFGRLGLELSRAPVEAAPRSGTTPRLAVGHASHLWDSSASLHVVRDLYAHYAADPLGPPPRRFLARPDSSGSDGTPSKGQFLERYVTQQAEIEALLVQGPVHNRSIAVPSGQLANNVNQVDDQQHLGIIKDAAEDHQRVDAFTRLEPSPPLGVVAHTRSLSIADTCMLYNSNFSGGACFTPPDARAFRLAVRPEASVATFPVAIGIVPMGLDFTEVSFFDRKAGIFLCLGESTAQEGQVRSLASCPHAPSGPTFHIFGHESKAQISTPSPGQGIAVHFYQEFRPFVGSGSMKEKLEAEVDKCRAVVEESMRKMVAAASRVLDENVAKEFVQSRIHAARSRLVRCKVPPEVAEHLDAEEKLTVAQSDCQACDAKLNAGKQNGQYDESLGEWVGQVRFQVEGRHPSELAECIVPDLGGRKLKLASWRPCILMYKPGTRAQVEWLVAEHD